jgi:hypothetical protein
VLEGTRRKGFEDQKKMVEELRWEVPCLIDVIVLATLHQLKTKEFIYSDSSAGKKWKSTRVQEHSARGDKIYVGGFSPAGLIVLDYYCDSAHAGVACARKFIG